MADGRTEKLHPPREASAATIARASRTAAARTGGATQEDSRAAADQTSRATVAWPGGTTTDQARSTASEKARGARIASSGLLAIAFQRLVLQWQGYLAANKTQTKVTHGKRT